MLKNKISIFLPILTIIITSILTFNILSTFSLTDYTLESPIYLIENNYIKNISPKTNINTFYQYFDTFNCQIKVVDKNNKEITNGYIYTGSITQVYNNNKLITSYTNIVKGDINNDGLVDKKDINTISSNIIENKTIEDHYLQAVDINNDNTIRANDIALLNYYLNKKYENLSLNINNQTLMTGETVRIIPTISPNIILNQNLTWTSSNEKVATVNNAGLVTAKVEGTAIITATTEDNSLQEKVTITVDNTIVLSSNSGRIYINGEDVKVYIKAIDYSDLTCSSSDETLATCTIEDKYLIISLPNTTRESTSPTITVSSTKYGSASYVVNIFRTYLNLFPTEACIPINTTGSGIISSMNAGTLTFEISNTNIIKESYKNANRFYIRTGNTAGDATITITESNGHTQKTFKAIVYNLGFTQIGSFGKVGGENIETQIIAENTGNLTCKSENEEIATCTIEDHTLIIKPINKGEVNITVAEDKCNAQKDFLVVIEGE